MPTAHMNRVLPRGSRAGAWVFWSAYLIAALIIILAYSSFLRPMWTDEFLHFALTGQSSAGELLLRINNPDPGTLTRQTGFYQFVNFVTLQITGANWTALRAPSIASGALLIWAAYTFLREREATRPFQFLGLVVIAGQTGFMYFVGEARPYMPYAATTLGLLAFFTASPKGLQLRSTKWLGGISLLLGAVFHLYFLLVLPIILAFAIWFRVYVQGRKFSWRAGFHELKLGWVISAVALSLLLGAFTWLRPQTPNTLDAFAWMGGSFSSFLGSSIQFHMEFSGASALRTTLVIIELLLLIFSFFGRRSLPRKELAASAVLFFVAIGTSIVVASSSILNHYAIAGRQLVAAPPIIAMAITWQALLLYRWVRRQPEPLTGLGFAPVAGCFAGGLFLVAFYLGLAVPVVPTLSTLALLTIISVLFGRKSKRRWYLQILTFALCVALPISTYLILLSTLPGRIPIGVSLAIAVGIPLVTYLRNSSKPPLERIVSYTLILAFCLVLVGAVSNRIQVLQEQRATYTLLLTKAETVSEVQYYDLPYSRLDYLAGTDEVFGSRWVLSSNLNAVRGGPVWPIFDEW